MIFGDEIAGVMGPVREDDIRGLRELLSGRIKYRIFRRKTNGQLYLFLDSVGNHCNLEALLHRIAQHLKDQGRGLVRLVHKKNDQHWTIAFRDEQDRELRMRFLRMEDPGEQARHNASKIMEAYRNGSFLPSRNPRAQKRDPKLSEEGYPYPEP